MFWKFQLVSEALQRDYKREYKIYHSNAEQKKNRASRNLARARAERKGSVKKGDGKDIDHKSGNPRNNSNYNVRVLSQGSNRSEGGRKSKPNKRLNRKY